MDRTELRLCGFGGQGLILAAHIIGKSAAVIEGRFATLNQSFGPEARGSACSAQLILADEQVDYPYVRRTDILVAMSQDAYRLYVNEVKPEGQILIDSGLVTPDAAVGNPTRGLPATRIAESLGRRIIANMVMVGFVTGATGLVEVESAREAIRGSVPSGTEELNLKAFAEGLDAALHDTASGRREVTA